MDGIDCNWYRNLDRILKEALAKAVYTYKNRTVSEPNGMMSHVVLGQRKYVYAYKCPFQTPPKRE